MSHHFQNTSLIITSIAAPNAAMKEYAEKCKASDIAFILIGDVSSPKDFTLEGCRFYSIEEQEKLSFRLAKLLPKKHYSRKNIGYLLSKDQDLILETDDDNFPKENFWTAKEKSCAVKTGSSDGWINVYHYFSKENIWPRGFPVEALYNETVARVIEEKLTCPIQQSLADHHPDVDAIGRLIYDSPVTFDPGKTFALGKNTWCPFNSQNTAWFKEAFPLMYLPSFCSFRMTDIWRSFIAQRIAWTCEWNILFLSSTVIQERNVHDLLKDFEEEIPGYRHNDRIRRLLEDLDLKAGEKNISENMLRCYREIIAAKLIDKNELTLLDAWLSEFN